MAGWLIAAIERLPPRERPAAVAAAAALLLAAAITALTLDASTTGVARRPTRAAHQLPPLPPARSSKPLLHAPVSGANLRTADRLAQWFLWSYLRFAYGKASAGSVKGVTPELRRQLITEPAQATPAERGRRPLIVSLATVGTTPGFVVATATIADGGVAAYRLRFTLQEQAGGWRVSSVQAG